MDYIVGLFLFGTIEFWLFWAIATVVIIVSLETERFGWGNTFAIVGALLIYLSFTHLAPGVLTLENILTYGAGYFGIGALWSIFKWWRHCKQAVEKAKEKIANQPNRFQSIHDDLTFELLVVRNEGRICAWIVYWPWSMLWNISRDMINTLFNALSGLYSNISNGAVNQLQKPKE